MTDVIITQHPVGQGGMMSGSLSVPGKLLTWVYDCGSNQTDDLNREINNIGTNTIDYLFLSHLDSDHMNGVGTLLSRTKVMEVVLPYLNEIDRFVALAHDVASGTITFEFQTFLVDVESWFTERGVERITYILPDNDDRTGNDGPNISPEPIIDNNLAVHWSSRGELVSKKAKKNIHVTKQKTTSYLNVGLESGNSWIFAPYAHRPSDKLLKLFADDLKRKFSVRKISNQLMISILKDKNKLKDLRDCYDNIWTDHNLVSMALYTGPGIKITKLGRSREHYRRRSGIEPWYNGWIESYSGWLSTGDMHLERIHRRTAFFSHYRKLLDLVHVFVLPHHGSKLNFDSSLIDAIPNCTQCVAATGPNNYGHPSGDVWSAVVHRDKEFIKVSEKPFTLLQWKYCI